MFSMDVFQMKEQLSVRYHREVALGPLMFSMYRNDLLLVLTKANTAMYADDSTIY